MIFPACDDWRYIEAGASGHNSCGSNLRKELERAVMDKSIIQDSVRQSAITDLMSRMEQWGWTPEPLNLFMNVPVGPMNGGEKGWLQVSRPVCRPGGYVVLRAEVDCLIVMSACPNDLMDTNGGNPSNAAFEVLRPL